MIILNSFNKIDIVYRNYIKQFSKAYIKGSPLYVGESLKMTNNFRKSILIQNVINRYKNKFIELYMNNNKIYEEVNNENLCVICLEDLNDDIMDVCHKCNVKCHINCLYDWYKKNNNEICPICLQTEEYYLNILKNNNNNDNSNTDLENLENLENNIIEEEIDNLDNYIVVYEPNKRVKTCLTVFFCMGLLFLILLFDIK